MTQVSDGFGLSGRRVARLAGVVPQTRDSWVQRGLLDAKATYEQSDLAEVVALRAMLDTLPKADAPIAWAQVRPKLRRRVTRQTAIVWDTERQAATLADSEQEIVKATVHGRPVQVLPIGALITEASAAFENEVAQKRKQHG